jgi:WXG100 family type VII secretion target
VRESIAVTPDAVRAVAGEVRRLADELRGAVAGAGAAACRVSGTLAGSAGFDGMWLAWSTALDQLAAALGSHARTLGAAADGYGEADAAAVPGLPAGP